LIFYLLEIKIHIFIFIFLLYNYPILINFFFKKFLLFFLTFFYAAKKPSRATPLLQKKLKGLSVFMRHVRSYIVDSDSVLTILSFTTLNNCFGNKGKIIFFRASKCYLSIDREQFSRSLFFYGQ
jgi:hypothetical protein